MRGVRTTLVLAGAAGLLAGCVTTAEPPPGPVLEYAVADCPAVVQLGSSVGLTPEKEKQAHTVTAALKSDASCLQTDAGASPYVLFALPADLDDKTIVAGGVLELTRILSPQVRLLDEQGAVTRSFAPEDYLYRGAVYSVQFRPRPSERFVMIAVDPARVGKRYDSITTGIATTTIYTGYGAANWNSGVEARSSRTFSWEGVAQVSVYDEDTKEGR